MNKKINEVTYTHIDLSEDDFDEIPTEDSKTEIPPAKDVLDAEDDSGEPPAPEFDDKVEDEELPIPSDEEDVDSIQNEIIKHNIEAMKNLNIKIESLGDLINGLSDKFDILSRDVEEVREPSTVEKMMNRKEDSQPFGYHLNDYWTGNWFNEQHGNNNGIRELPDGTYIASFDDLPKYNDLDVEKSFDY